MRKLGRCTKMRVALEAAFGVAYGANYYAPRFYSVATPSDPDEEDDPVLGGETDNCRDPVDGVQQMPGGELRMTVPYDLGMMGLWYKLAFGAPVTAGSAPNYTHAFESGGEGLPSATFQLQFASGDVGIYRGFKLSTLGLSMDKTTGKERVDLSFRGVDWDYETAHLAGSAIVSPPAVLDILKVSSKALWNGVAMGDVLAATLNFSNNLDPYNTMSGTEYPAEIDEGLTTLTGTFRARLKDRTLRQISKAKTPGALSFLHSHPGDAANRQLLDAMGRVTLTYQGGGPAGPGGMDESFNFKAKQSSSAPALVSTLKNAHPGY